MFEDLKIDPLSAEDLQAKILRRYKDNLETREKLNAEMDKLPKKYYEGLVPGETELLYEQNANEEYLLPLYFAASGFFDPLKSRLIGTDVVQILHPLTERAVRKALAQNELQSAAEELARIIITPDEIWTKTIKRIRETHRLYNNLDRPKEKEPIVYEYCLTVCAEGRAENKVFHLGQLCKNWEKRYYGRLADLIKKIEVAGLPLQLVDIKDLEYTSSIVERLRETIANKGTITGKISFYIGNSLTFLTEELGAYVFRAYGNADRVVKNILERTLDAGFSVRKRRECLRPITEPVYWFSVS